MFPQVLGDLVSGTEVLLPILPGSLTVLDNAVTDWGEVTLGVASDGITTEGVSLSKEVSPRLLVLEGIYCSNPRSVTARPREERLEKSMEGVKIAFSSSVLRGRKKIKGDLRRF